MPHLGLQRSMIPGSQVSSLTTGNITLAGAKSAFDVGPYGAFEPLAVVTVGSGGASSVEFSGIPSTYSHLQVRVTAQTSRSTYGNDSLSMRMNNDATAYYSYHGITGDGSGTSSFGSSSQTSIYLGYKLGTTTSGAFGIFIINILNYSDISTNTTVSNLAGVDIAGTIAGYGGEVELSSGGWYSTNQVKSLTFIPANANFTENSKFSLYGVK